ncbi:hypothetical protein BX600DRAFT_465900 [Xylariales sp. PMI_506]|nr:hypothetical protein BX600DRAFT_465900 [Xylariales sp. PMI_506]
MADEPTLPRLPSVSWNADTQSFNNTRKRVRGDDPAPAAAAAAAALFSNSSDPAVFSSDDDPNLENYTQGRRRKKRYVGSWFQQQPASSDSAFSEETRPKPMKKRTLERQFDSGVWMGSDSSLDTDEAGLLEMPPPAACRLPQLNVSRMAAMVSAAEEAAKEKILRAIEDGDEDIDLTSLGLEYLSNAAIVPLSEFSCIPTVTPGVPFEQRDPSLKIFLSANPLNKAPGALFNLEFLTVLSLRNTRITEIPPCIGNLRNLETLNLSLNRLRWLPGELLDLMTYPSKLKDLMIHPNPFYQPGEDIPLLPDEDGLEFENSEHTVLLHESTVEDGAIFRLWLDKRDGLEYGQEYPAINDNQTSRWRARALARTPVQYMDSRGTVISKYCLPRSDLGATEASGQCSLYLETEDLSTPPALPYGTRESATSLSTASRVPSLLELALKACSKTTQLPVLPSYLPADTAPHLRELLEQIITRSEENANTGDLPCSTCGRRIIMPLAQWIEWWDVANMSAATSLQDLRYNTGKGEERAIPFMRRACSLRCLPIARAVGTMLPGTLRWGLERQA